MVKKSFFARLFGRGGNADAAVEVPSRAASKAGGGAGSRVATKARLPDIDFDEEAEKAKRTPPRANGTNAPNTKSASSGKPLNGVKAASPSNGNGAATARPELEEIIPSSKAAAPAADKKPIPPEAPSVKVEAVVQLPSNEPIQATEMTRREEISLKLQEGFTGLSTVLRGIDTKIDQQQKTSEELIVSVRRIPEMIKDMPDASRAGIELLNTISSILEFQGRSTNELLAKMRDLPGSLDAMEQRFQDQVTQLARTSEQADRSARETQQRLTSEFQGVKRAVEDVQVTTSRRQETLVEELRKHQASQDARVEELLKRNSSSTRLVVFLLVIAIVALLVAVYGMQR